MATYRVIRKGHWVEGKMVPPGGLVEINGDLPAGLADRLELVSEQGTDGSAATVDAPQTGPSTVTLTVTPGPDADIAADWKALPQSIVSLLVGAGLVTPELVRKATDDQLLALEGIGAAKVKVIREILA